MACLFSWPIESTPESVRRWPPGEIPESRHASCCNCSGRPSSCGRGGDGSSPVGFGSQQDPGTSRPMPLGIDPMPCGIIRAESQRDSAPKPSKRAASPRCFKHSHSLFPYCITSIFSPCFVSRSSIFPVQGFNSRSLPPTVEVISSFTILPAFCSAVTRKPPWARSL